MSFFPIFSFSALSLLFEQLSDLLSAGLNLSRALVLIYDLEKNPKRQQILGEIIDQIQAGSDFSDALSQYPKIFPASTTTLIRAGEASGTLEIILEKIIVNRQTLSQIKSSFTQALSYPSILLVVALTVMGVLLLMVIPQFADMFEKFNAPLPKLTRVLLNISDFLQQYTLYILLAIIGVISLSKIAITSSTRVKLKLHQLMLHLPLIGKILKNFNMARFCTIMQLLLEADIKLLPALKISAMTLDNQYLTQKILNLIPPIKNGAALSKVMAASGEFSYYTEQMLVVGEETGNLASAFGKVSHYYQKHITLFIARLKTYLEPAMIIFISLFIGIMLLGMYQPIFKLNQLF